MKRKYFIRRLFVILFSYLVPVTFACASFTYFIVQNTMADMLQKVPASIQNLQDNIETALDTTGHISVMLNNHPNIKLAISKMLNHTELTYSELVGFQFLQSLIKTPVDANIFIDSIYVYLPNQNDKFVASGLGILNIEQYADRGWYDRLPHVKNLHMETREIKSYSFEQATTSLLTIYRSVHGGVVVTNLDTGYFNRLLRSYRTFDGEIILVVSQNDEIFFNSQSVRQPEQLARMINSHHSNHEFWFDETNYILHTYPSAKYPFMFVSLIPKSEILSMLMKRISKIILWGLLLSVILAVLTAYLQVRRNFRQLQTIIDVFNNAKKGIMTESSFRNENDEYSLILNKVVQVFISQSFLKMQLSERTYRQKAAELTALQLQINPHFLFNTLQSIQFELIRINQDQSVIDILQSLVALLRYSMEDRHRKVTLQEEIQYSKIYCEIQKYRYEDKFEMIWDSELKDLNIPFSRLIFQPLIENSLMHGIGPKEESGCIKIKMRKQHDRLEFRVIDNGVGMDKVQLQKVRNQVYYSDDPLSGEHLGLANTNSRLMLKYGKDSQLRIQSKQGWGTVVSFSIPYEVQNKTFLPAGNSLE